MISKQYEKYVLVCDNCLYEEERLFNSTSEVFDFKKNKENGWKAHMNYDGVWEDNCPSCAKIMYQETIENYKPKEVDAKCHNQNIHKYPEIMI